MKNTIIFTILFGFIANAQSQNTSYLHYEKMQTLKDFDEKLGNIDHGTLKFNCYLSHINEKALYYECPDTVYIRKVGISPAFYYTDSIQQLSLIDTSNKTHIYKGIITVKSKSFTNDVENEADAPIETYKQSKYFKYTLLKKKNYKWEIFKQTKVINGLKCFKTELRCRGKLYLIAWYYPKIKTPYTINNYPNPPGLIMEAVNSVGNFTYKLKNYKINEPINNDVFNIKEMSEAEMYMYLEGAR